MGEKNTYWDYSSCKGIYYPAKVEEIQVVGMIKSAKKKDNSNYPDYNKPVIQRANSGGENLPFLH